MPNWIREIKWFIQRGKRGWADCDVWSFDNYLNKIIIAGIERLAKNQMGCPGEFWDETRKNDECHRWRETLEEMRQGFMAMEEQDNHSYFFKRNKEGQNEFDKERNEQLEKKVLRGLELFCKHYRSLWD